MYNFNQNKSIFDSVPSASSRDPGILERFFSPSSSHNAAYLPGNDYPLGLIVGSCEEMEERVRGDKGEPV